ncbi:hypothetical protein BpHYR1_028166 [Brachionus plicatilis]|uniref:Uncharacterized protein n=1 Tax=Brachionus plicatilis TaxID=10195 RepID=A0A3M7Q7U1_BRAPC|nr:hypothetical protein BpHYR1_028166 [Brachionus plicatilis]
MFRSAWRFSAGTGACRPWWSCSWIVAARGATAVDHDRKELVVAVLLGRCIRQVLFDIESLWKGDYRADFEPGHGSVVEVESLQLQGKNVGKRFELEALVSGAFLLACFAVVLVVFVEDFGLNERVQRLFHTLECFVRTEWSDAKRHLLNPFIQVNFYVFKKYYQKLFSLNFLKIISIVYDTRNIEYLNNYYNIFAKLIIIDNCTYIFKNLKNTNFQTFHHRTSLDRAPGHRAVEMRLHCSNQMKLLSHEFELTFFSMSADSEIDAVVDKECSFSYLLVHLKLHPRILRTEKL